MKLKQTNCPFCNEEIEENTTYDIEDIDPELKGKYTEVISHICMGCLMELLIFVGDEPMAIARSIKGDIKDMEVI